MVTKEQTGFKNKKYLIKQDFNYLIKIPIIPLNKNYKEDDFLNK